MVRLGWPRAPLILGLVLGGVIENYLLLTVSRYGVEWLARPMVAFLLALSVAVALSPYVRDFRRRRRAG